MTTENKLTGELALMAALDRHLSQMGPKTRAAAAECVAEAIDVALKERLEPDIIRRGVGWVVTRAREAAKEAEDEYARRKAAGEKPEPPKDDPELGQDRTEPPLPPPADEAQPAT